MDVGCEHALRLVNLPRLSELSVTGCRDYSEGRQAEHARIFDDSNAQQIVRLALEQIVISKRVSAALAKCTKLEELSLCLCVIDQDAAVNLRNNSMLRSIRLFNNVLDPSQAGAMHGPKIDWSCIGYLNRVENLELNEFEADWSARGSWVSQLEHLRVLDISHLEIDGHRALSIPRDFPCLRSLYGLRAYPTTERTVSGTARAI